LASGLGPLTCTSFTATRGPPISTLLRAKHEQDDDQRADHRDQNGCAHLLYSEQREELGFAQKRRGAVR